MNLLANRAVPGKDTFNAGALADDGTDCREGQIYGMEAFAWHSDEASRPGGLPVRATAFHASEAPVEFQGGHQPLRGAFKMHRSIALRRWRVPKRLSARVSARVVSRRGSPTPSGWSPHKAGSDAETHFADARLDAATVSRLRGLRARYASNARSKDAFLSPFDVAGRRDGFLRPGGFSKNATAAAAAHAAALTAGCAALGACVVHSSPLVTAHPRTGAPALHLDVKQQLGLEGLTFEASQILLEDVVGAAAAPDKVYRHRWTRGETPGQGYQTSRCIFLWAVVFNVPARRSRVRKSAQATSSSRTTTPRSTPPRRGRRSTTGRASSRGSAYPGGTCRERRASNAGILVYSTARTLALTDGCDLDSRRPLFSNPGGPGRRPVLTAR